ncbi:protein translocase subunit SecD [Sphingomonas koreensis]|jgi:preprotein translocase subunit SecD|uniref:Protein translocase subunit SecD n=1 Tax=Sphingomonas koreensis TaxID=93064 RepID=A0A1L6JE46_9SPHN|nr:protein translocase subunit SecD [Sphingomonas koreensis]APR54193.1 protein-export membrane protein SecD [Sphingomonas koreensis]MDC7809190.1 protein translocase subunit SecD [Sphingomonas koreensis]PJI90231.1 preprotein translocase subunit SecD [Sphingomonas koreensis]RSU17277.1 protein translocase subunit SecD [Sphingomonas koreensis]RSU21772.1 protein translocase subunit SecD [Sphingomonas koreensis]
MLDFPKWKVWAVWLTIIVSFVCAIPSFVPANVRAQWPSWIPQPTVNLGLDLAGGSYILLEADTADLAKSRLAAKRDEIETEFRRQDPRIDIGEISLRDGAISFMVRDPAQVDAARERLLQLTGSGAGMTGQREWTIEVRDATRFVVSQTQAGNAQAIDQAMGDAREVVDRRINALGTLEPTIVRQGTDRIVVQVPGLQDPEALKALLGKTARLEFKLVDITASSAQIATGTAPIGSEIMPYPSAPPGLPYVAYPTKEGEQPRIALKRQTIVGGDQLIDARQEFDQNQQVVVGFTFDSNGGRRFAQTTRENTNKPFAIIVDGSVISAPNINEPILGGRGQISGGFTVESANQLAIALRSGKMPVKLDVIEESTISPELGADSIEAGIIAGSVGTAAIVVLMLLAYFRFGVYANIALFVNVVMIIGVMALFNATLTLPGIAGFVLTIGAAVDANVLINERIREEVRRGRSNNAAIEFGYKEASRAIFDANITNVIAAAIMFVFGAGPVRGFAVVLTIGIITSVFTAVTFTRLMVSNWLKTRPKELVI